jgi:hypothetical protein
LRRPTSDTVEAIIARQDEMNAIVARQGMKMEQWGDDVRSIIAWQHEMNAIGARHEADYFAEVREKGLQAEQ